MSTSEAVAARSSRDHAYHFKNEVTLGAGPGHLEGLFIDGGGCTAILGLDLAEARNDGQQAYERRRRDLARAVAPDPGRGDDRATADEIKGYLAAHGWERGKKYVILSFRDAGHARIQEEIAAAPPEQRPGVIAAYDPVRDQVGGNHPELDTGTVGIQQLAGLVRARGFVPVFMGEEPADAPEPHLIRYRELAHEHGEPRTEKKLCRGGRAAEAFFLRMVAETYDVRLLSMRSGVTDQLAFLGIPTISIDVDDFHQAPVPELSETPGYRMGGDQTAHAWARGTALEAGLERDYGRVFLEEPRPLNDFDDRGTWKGTFGERDLATIDDALGFYFGTGYRDAPEHNGVRHKSHPFHPGKMARTDDLGDSDALHRAALGKIDTGLNPRAVLAHMRAVLRARPPKLNEAVRFADSQLEFMEGGQRRDFLDAVIALLTPHGEQGKYQAELDLLEALPRERPRPARRDRV